GTAQEEAVRVPAPAVLRLDRLHPGGPASPGRRDRPGPDRHGHRLSLSLDEHVGGPHPERARLQRSGAGGDAGRHRGEAPEDLILAAFRVRSFRYQWPADLLTSWASEMESIILGWYVMVHTGSVLLLTVFGSLQFLGTLVAPMFGVLGDRVGARLMLCIMRGIYAGLAGLLLLLAATGWLTPGWVLLIAGLNGIFRPNDLVMRNSLIGETIPPAELMGAVGLSRATMDSA